MSAPAGRAPVLNLLPNCCRQDRQRRLGRREVLLGAAAALLPGLAAAQAEALSDSERAAWAPRTAALAEALASRWTDVDSLVIVHRRQVAWTYYRDGDAGKLRDVQSIDKSAIASLIGMALGQGRIASLDQPVADLVPGWKSLNTDPRAQAVTVRHVLTQTSGFEPYGGASGTARPAPWSRPLQAEPGQRFAYDNANVLILTAVLEAVTGMPLADYARRELVRPLGMAEPGYAGGLRMTTLDMAKLGMLYAQNGIWDGRPLIPRAFVEQATQKQNAGGRPVGMPYGFMWWILPDPRLPGAFMASGYGGQLIWVAPSLDAVIACTSPAQPASQGRGHAVQLLSQALIPMLSELRPPDRQ